MRRVIWIVGALWMAGCNGCDRGHPWPAEVGDNFMASCQGSSTERACRCALREMRRLYTYDEFRDVEPHLRALDVPIEVSEVIAACSGR